MKCQPDLHLAFSESALRRLIASGTISIADFRCLDPIGKQRMHAMFLQNLKNTHTRSTTHIDQKN